MIEYQEGFFESHDGLQLYRRSWEGGTKATIVLVHGFGDHSGRFRFLVKALHEDGFHIEAFDCRGHGRSPGERGHIESFQDYLDDLHAFLQWLSREEDRPSPMFLLGHSQGAHIVLRYCMMHEHQDVRGVAVSSPFLGLRSKLSLGLRVTTKLAEHLLPRFAMPVGIQEEELTHDPEVIEETKRDPLYGHDATSRWLRETLRAIDETQQNAHRFSLPLLMQQAGDERIVDKQAAIRFFEHCGSEDRQRLEYPELFHEIYNETPTRRETVLADLLRWLNEHL